MDLVPVWTYALFTSVASYGVKALFQPAYDILKRKVYRRIWPTVIGVPSFFILDSCSIFTMLSFDLHPIRKSRKRQTYPLRFW